MKIRNLSKVLIERLNPLKIALKTSNKEWQYNMNNSKSFFSSFDRSTCKFSTNRTSTKIKSNSSVEECFSYDNTPVKLKSSDFTNDLLLVCEEESKNRYIRMFKMYGPVSALIGLASYFVYKYFKSLTSANRIIGDEEYSDEESKHKKPSVDLKNNQLLFIKFGLSLILVASGGFLLFYSSRVYNRIISRIYLHKTGKHLKIVFPFHTEIIEISEFDKVKPEGNYYLNADEFIMLSNEGTPIMIKGDCKLISKNSTVHHKKVLASIGAKKNMQISD